MSHILSQCATYMSRATSEAWPLAMSTLSRVIAMNLRVIYEAYTLPNANRLSVPDSPDE